MNLEYIRKMAKGDPEQQYITSQKMLQYFTEEGNVWAAKFCKASAEQGYLDAQVEYARMCLSGIGMEQDADEAMKWAQTALAGGGDTQYIIDCINRSDREKLNYIKHIQDITMDALFAGDDYKIGRIFQSIGNIEYAKKHLARAAEDGNADAAVRLAIIYASEGGDENILESNRYLELSFDFGQTDAYFIMGFSFLGGRENIPPDVERAIGYFEKGAELGDAESLAAVGVANLVYSDTVEKAVGYLRKSADAGCPAGIRLLLMTPLYGYRLNDLFELHAKYMDIYGKEEGNARLNVTTRLLDLKDSASIEKYETIAGRRFTDEDARFLLLHAFRSVIDENTFMQSHEEMLVTLGIKDKPEAGECQ